MRFKRHKSTFFYFALLTVAISTNGYGSACGPYGCPPQRPPSRIEAGSLPRESIGRVSHQTAQGVSSGTATLISHGEGASYFVTCSHLFDDGPGRTEITSRSIGRLSARIVARDRGHDLVLLETRRCRATPARVAEVQGRSELTACGFGPTGQYRCVRGPIVGYATPQGATSPSLRIRGAVRPGDSGGPVFDRSGRLVAVIWGERGGETYATFGGPLRRLLSRLPRRQPNHQPRLVPVERIPAQEPTLPTSPSIIERPNVDPAWRERVDRRLAANESAWRAMDLSPFAKREELRTATSSWGFRVGKIETRLRGIAERTAELAKGTVVGAGQVASAAGWMAPLLSALGIGGPIGAALLAGQFLIRRRSRSSRPSGRPSHRHSSSVSAVERPIAVDSPPPPQQVVPETHYVSYERDEYAKAHQWASEQLARKFPGSVEMLTSLDSLIRQRVNAFK